MSEELKHVCQESEFNPLADDICPACVYENAKRLGYFKQAEKKALCCACFTEVEYPLCGKCSVKTKKDIEKKLLGKVLGILEANLQDSVIVEVTAKNIHARAIEEIEKLGG